MMGSIITRSALIAWGREPPPELHSIVNGRMVTWADAMDFRRERQRERLDSIRREYPAWRACRLSVAYFDMTLMGGWQAFI